jgi:hypothetical protein
MMQTEINLPYINRRCNRPQTPGDEHDARQTGATDGDLIERSLEPVRRALQDAGFETI